MVGLGLDIGDIADYVAHNDLGTAVLLRALAERGFRGRLVLASSMVVYGEGRYACPEHGIVRAAAAPRRRSRSRPLRAAVPGLRARARRRAPSPRTPRSTPATSTPPPRSRRSTCAPRSPARRAPRHTALRYHNVYGPRMPRDTPYAGVASIFRSALAAGDAPRVFEDGGQRRDFVHVRDVARANLLALTEPVTGAFNVASGTPRTVLDMARALTRAVAPDREPVVTGQWRAGDVRHVFASADAAADRLGFHAQEDFDAAMHEFAAAPLRA